TGREVTSDDVYSIFASEYLTQNAPWQLIKHRITGSPSASEGQRFEIEVEFEVDGQRKVMNGQGDGAISAFVNSLNLPVRIVDYHEHAIGTGTETRAACYVEVKIGDDLPGFGVGVDVDIVSASFKA